MRDTKVLIAVPALDTMPTLTAYSMLTMQKDCPSRFSFIVRASCHDARNMLAREAIDSGADRVLWIDSDMVFGDDLMLRLGEDLDKGYDMVGGIYFRREIPTSPLVYKSLGEIESKTIMGDTCARAEVWKDYPRDRLFQCAGYGFGAVMMTTELLRRVGDYAFTPFNHLSEDLSFCARAQEAGARIACDSRVKVGHVGQIVIGEQLYKHPGG